MLEKTFCCVIVLSAIGIAPLTAGPGACRDIPLRVTLFNYAGSTIPSAIYSDGGGEYVDGVSGVSAAIKICSGTNDAVLNVSSSKRTFTFAFPSPISGSVITQVPAWIPGVYAGSGWINVRNMLYSKQQFTTHLGSTFTLPIDRSTYRLRFMAYQVDAPDLHVNPSEIPDENNPYPASPVVVYPNYPAVCGPGNMPSWRVLGTNPNSLGMMQVGTLHKEVSSKGTLTLVHEGQYSTPFELRIEALQCFNY